MTTPTLTIDGSIGEGGGQILRTALALSIVTGQTFRMENIRANRAKPGLQAQHLVAVRAAATVSQADVTGADLGSQTVIFQPCQVTPGDYAFDLGGGGYGFPDSPVRQFRHRQYGQYGQGSPTG